MPPNPVELGLAPPPIGEDLINPPMLTWCLCDMDNGRPLPSPPVFCLLSSDIQVGCVGVPGLDCGFGESGLLRAVSSQLALVGLQRRGSIVLEGLVGILASGSSTLAASVSAMEGSGAIVLADVSISSCCSPWRDDGLLDPGVVDFSRITLCGREPIKADERSYGPLFEAIESARVSPGGLVTLHRLTLSDLFIMAL